MAVDDMISDEPNGRLMVALCWLALTACGHGTSAKKPDAAPVVRSTPASSAGSKPAQPTEHIEDFMADHFVIVTYSRDAVINGELEALREPLQALADYEYKNVAPGDWVSWILQIQAAARLTSESETLAAAASGVASMARSCGGCHEATGGGPDFGGPSKRERASPPSDTLDARMKRHMWAVDRVWEGLTAPSDEAWTDGTSALEHTPATPPITDPPLPPRFVTALLAMRELAAEASDATSLAQRADVYGRLLAGCAGCHAYGVELSF
jgi:hypothetical protein